MGLTAVAAEAEEANQGAYVGVHEPECLEGKPLQAHTILMNTRELLHAGYMD